MYADFNKEKSKEGHKFKVIMITLEYQNMKIYLQKAMFQICLKKFLWLKRLKNTESWTYVISDLNGEEIIATFYEKELQKHIKKKLGLEM